jgi:hypothetical protein
MPKEFCKYEIEFEFSEDPNENLKRFWFECFKKAISCFPRYLISDLDLSSYVLCPKVDIARVSSPE